MKKDDQRTKITKMIIKNTFIELLASKPVQSITVKELCEKAEINRGTFYKHYLDVYDLKEKIENAFVESISIALLPLSQITESEAPRTEVISTVFEVIQNNVDFSAYLISQHADNTFLYKLLNVGYKSYISAYLRFFPNADEQKLNYYYSFISAGFIGIMHQWLAGGAKEDATQLAIYVEGMMMNGIGFLKSTSPNVNQ